MKKISHFDLISGADISYEGICTLRQPTLERIRSLKGGYARYTAYLNVLMMDLEFFLSEIGLKEKYQALPEEKRALFSPYYLHLANPATKEILQEALSFFLREKVVFSPEQNIFLLFPAGANAPCGHIGNENYEDVRYGILQINCLASSFEGIPKKFKNAKAREIYEAIQKGKQKAAAQGKADKALLLSNMISAVSAQHNSYNLLNIWGLTVYQLQDQFGRLNLKTQYDISALRWAAWGKESFDFSIWYQNLNV